MTGLKAYAVHIGVEDIDPGEHRVVGEIDDLIEVGRQEHARIEDEQGNDGGHDAGDRHVPDLLPAIGAVDLGGIVELGIDGDDGGEIEQTVPARRAPDFREHQHPADGAGVGHVGTRRDAEQAGDMVDDATGGRKRRDGYPGDHHPGKKVGQIDCRLHEFAQRARSHFVEQESHDDRYGEDEDHLHARDDQRVEKHLPEDRRIEQGLEMQPAHPDVGRNDAHLLEGDLGLPDGQVMEDDEEYDARRQHQVIGPPDSQLEADGREVRRACRFGNVPNIGYSRCELFLVKTHG